MDSGYEHLTPASEPVQDGPGAEPAPAADGAGVEPSERLPRLLKKARGLPAAPGVYLMKDASGVVLYVGKAARLPDRVASYFVPSADLNVKNQQLVIRSRISRCEGESEALLTNIRLVDDKTLKLSGECSMRGVHSTSWDSLYAAPAD